MRLISLIIFTFGISTVVAQTDTVFNLTDADNLRQGYWKKEWPNGNLMYKAFFVDNKPRGEMRRYYESGRLKAIMNYANDGDHSFARLFYENGNPAADGKYYKTLKDSIWTYYSFFSKTVSSKESWNRGIREGMMISYYDNGDISEKLEWKSNKKSGIWEQYFKGSILKMKARYVDNKLEGEFVVYTIKGAPYLSGNYRNNLRDGEWIFYTPEGKAEQVLNYKSGTAAEIQKLNAEQQEFFRNLDEAQGKYNEPDETDFLPPSR